MFRVAYRWHTAHQELQTVFAASGLYTNVVIGRCPGWVSSDPAWTTADHHMCYKPEAENTVWSSWWWAVCRSKHVEPSVNFGIINSITRLHLVGISTEPLDYFVLINVFGKGKCFQRCHRIKPRTLRLCVRDCTVVFVCSFELCEHTLLYSAHRAESCRASGVTAGAIVTCIWRGALFECRPGHRLS
jgi:hypothetical protein